MPLFTEQCSAKELCAEFGANEKLLNQLRNELEDWLKLQPHLPQGASKKRLESFILGSKMSLEQAKQKLDMYYTIRELAPEFFTDRDPRGPGLSTLYNVMQNVFLPNLTPEKYTISIIRAMVNDPSKIDPVQIVKNMIMTCDIQMEECRSSGHIYIFDLALMSLAHLKMLTPMIIQKYQMTTKAYPVRIKGFHFINVPSFIDRLILLLKAILSPKLASRLYVHSTDNLESLYEIVPKSILPKDYGGDQLTMAELSDMWQEKLGEWRDWFSEQNTILVNERLRPSAIVNKEYLYGCAGSFRKLDID